MAEPLSLRVARWASMAAVVLLCGSCEMGNSYDPAYVKRVEAQRDSLLCIAKDATELLSAERRQKDTLHVSMSIPAWRATKTGAGKNVRCGKNHEWVYGDSTGGCRTTASGAGWTTVECGPATRKAICRRCLAWEQQEEYIPPPPPLTEFEALKRKVVPQ